VDDVTRLIEQWAPAAYQAGRIVGRKFRSSKQERADLRDNALVALWVRIASGHVKPDSPPALVVRMVVVTLTTRGALGIKGWCPKAYFSRVGARRGKAIYRFRPVGTMTDTYGEDRETASAGIPARAVSESGSDPVELVARLARGCGLSDSEKAALLDCASGGRKEGAKRRGITSNRASADLYRATQKMIDRNPNIVEVLT
jgi:hypothetical protein